MVKTLIIDSESESRQALKSLIEEYCPMVEILATYEDAPSGFEGIRQYHPDLVFLDIELPNQSGFKLLESFGQRAFEVIFTTTNEQYAVDAFRVSATDYLLKPIAIEDLIHAVDKVVMKRASDEKKRTIGSVEKSKRISLPVNQGMLTISSAEVYYFESDGRYTHIHLADGSRQTTKQSLKECEVQFKEHLYFLRIHRSFLINLYHIKRYAKGAESYVEMINGDQLPVGKGYKDNLSDAITLFIH